MTEMFERLNRIDPTINLRSELEQLRQRAEAAETRALQLETELQTALTPPPESEPEVVSHSTWALQVAPNGGAILIDGEFHRLFMERSWAARIPVWNFVTMLNQELAQSGSDLKFIWPGEDSGAASS